MTEASNQTGRAKAQTDGGRAALHQSATTIYFDGSCPVCAAEIGYYASRDGGNRLDFVDVSKQDPKLAPGLTRDAAMRRFHVRRSDGVMVSGAPAFVAVWETLPGWRWLALAARIPGAIWVLERAYRAFLLVRPALSRTVAKLKANGPNGR